MIVETSDWQKKQQAADKAAESAQLEHQTGNKEANGHGT